MAIPTTRAGVPILHVNVLDSFGSHSHPPRGWVALIPTMGGVKKTVIYKKEGHSDEIQTTYLACPGSAAYKIIDALRPKDRLQLRIIYPNDARGECEKVLYQECEVKAVSHTLPSEDKVESFEIIFESNWEPVPYTEEVHCEPAY